MCGGMKKSSKYSSTSITADPAAQIKTTPKSLQEVQANRAAPHFRPKPDDKSREEQDDNHASGIVTSCHSRLIMGPHLQRQKANTAKMHIMKSPRNPNFAGSREAVLSKIADSGSFIASSRSSVAKHRICHVEAGTIEDGTD